MASASTNSFVPVSADGLDRTKITSKGEVELVQLSSSSESEDIHDEKHFNRPATNLSPSNAKPKSKRKRLLLKTKEKLHIGTPESDSAAPILADAPDTHSDSRLGGKPPEPEKHTAHDILHNPVSTIQSKATGQGGHQIAANLVAQEISHGTDVEIVKAQKEVGKTGTEKQRKQRVRSLEVLLKERQDMFIRWTMDRHVTKLRVLPVGTVPERSRAEFKKLAKDGKVKTDWEAYANHLVRYNALKYGPQYIGYGSDPPTPSKETLMPAVERLLVASAPMQTLIMSIRKIYRWDNRKQTLKYLIIYSVLWIFNLVLPGCLAALVYFILRRRVHAPTIDDLEKDIKRTEDMEQTALTLSEFIEKRGDQNWVDPLIEDVGPWLMVQLADMADLMETLRNFYEWRVPSQTGVTLGIMTAGLLAITFTPIQLMIRLSSLFSGITFFALFPIASRFPEYRLLASPMKWLFWNIPTHAEWSIAVIQAEGQRHRNATSSHEHKTKIFSVYPDAMGNHGTPRTLNGVTVLDSTPPVPPKDNRANILGSYSCSHDSKNGRLILDPTGVHFKSSIGHSQHFNIRYSDISKLEKTLRIVSKGLSKNSGEDLKIVGIDGREYLLTNMEDRDQAFSQIVGFSSARWQVVW